MPAWRERLLTRLAPPISLCGVAFGDWLRVLRDNHFAVDPPYLPRAASVTLGSLTNSLQRRYEQRAYGPKVAGVQVQPPLFILGHWRSGTTPLHYLLAADRRLAYPTTYQVSYPHTFLSAEAVASRLGNLLLPTKRPMDDVRISFRAPNEDEFALCQMTLCSPYLGFTFPRRQPHYDRFLTLRGAGEGVVARWKAALAQFLRKLTWKDGRPLVLKSPPHTGRIGLLLELFPGARFVHIRRNPYAVFESTWHWLRASGPWFHLQRPARTGLDERVLRVYREVYEVFFEERGLIPRGRFHEVGFEELERDPVGQVRAIYEALGLPDFGEAEPALRRYLDSLVGYKKNAFPGLPADLRERVAREWRRCFEEWGYPT
jgi:hypothetical protein